MQGDPPLAFPLLGLLWFCLGILLFAAAVAFLDQIVPALPGW